MMASHNRLRRFDESAILGMVVIERDVIRDPSRLEENELILEVERAYEYADQMLGMHRRGR